MFRYRTYLLLLFALLVGMAPSAAIAEESQTSSPAEVAQQQQTLLVGVQSGLTAEQVAEQLAAAGLVMTQYWERFGVAEVIAPVDDGTPTAMTASAEQKSAFIAAANPQFRYVELNQPVYAACCVGGSAGPA